jgi:hydrogenase maturation protease
MQKEIIYKIIVLGIGNLLLGDEGLGIHLIQRLKEEPLKHTNVEIIDAGICNDFTSFIDDHCGLIIVDAITEGREPGTVYNLTINDMVRKNEYSSLHSMDILDSLRLLEALGKKPYKTVVTGIEPKSIAPSLALSTEVSNSLNHLMQIVLSEIDKLNTELSSSSRFKIQH